MKTNLPMKPRSVPVKAWAVYHGDSLCGTINQQLLVFTRKRAAKDFIGTGNKGYSVIPVLITAMPSRRRGK